MMPGTWNTSVVAGDTFRTTVTWETGDTPTPVNLTDYSATFTVYDDAGDPLIQATDGDGITLGGAAGTIAIIAQTAGVDPGCYRYTLVMETAGTGTDPITQTLLVGSFGVI